MSSESLRRSLARFSDESEQRAVDLCLGQRIGELERGDVFEHGLNEAGVGHQAEAVAGQRAAVAGQAHLERLDAEDAALGCDLAVDLDLAANQRVEQRARRIECFGPEREIAEEFGQRGLARQADGADAAGAIEYGEAFQEVIDLIEAHREIDAGAAGDGAGMRELREADAREHHSAQAATRRRRRVRRRGSRADRAMAIRRALRRRSGRTADVFGAMPPERSSAADGHGRRRSAIRHGDS